MSFLSWPGAVVEPCVRRCPGPGVAISEGVADLVDGEQARDVGEGVDGLAAVEVEVCQREEDGVGVDHGAWGQGRRGGDRSEGVVVIREVHAPGALAQEADVAHAYRGCARSTHGVECGIQRPDSYD